MGGENDTITSRKVFKESWALIFFRYLCYGFCTRLFEFFFECLSKDVNWEKVVW